ncbi:uncharacterized protein LOC121375628 [Gigantopelta aegis]|uniref:uncharacterized protein LOC121375628 n=1 Tax=Gigantopelta aegis TaxID=1735272 RepID=UPI001B88E418|nr:uncharacterized protein LOC121375628 [Gigantopelta aegis]
MNIALVVLCFYRFCIVQDEHQVLELTDGECLERLWSYLGKFSNITKEMTPENRTDLLVDALIYYGHKIRNKLAQCVTPSEVQKWSDDERLQTQTQTQIRQNQNENYTPEEPYAVNLRQYQHFQEAFSAAAAKEICKRSSYFNKGGSPDKVCQLCDSRED